MASNVKLPVARPNPAQGFTPVPLFNASGKWRDVLNFRFYKGVASVFKRKASYVTATATTQTLTIPTQTCRVNS